MRGQSGVGLILTAFNRFDTIQDCHGQTDRQTDTFCQQQHVLHSVVHVTIVFAPGTSVIMYGALKSAGSRLPNVGLSSVQSRVADRLSASIVTRRTFAIRSDFSETVYDNEDGGPKCRGIELLRDPNFNKVRQLTLHGVHKIDINFILCNWNLN